MGGMAAGKGGEESGAGGEGEEVCCGAGVMGGGGLWTGLGEG